MKFENIFVTVGTTEFNELIEKLCEKETYDILKNKLNCKNLKIQRGKGKTIDFSHLKGINVEQFDMKNSIEDDILSADLVNIFFFTDYKLFIS